MLLSEVTRQSQPAGQAVQIVMADDEGLHDRPKGALLSLKCDFSG
jgi:hypothetical protein